jgi:hypothetical protein
MDNEVRTALMGRLREIVSGEPWDQDRASVH